MKQNLPGRGVRPNPGKTQEICESDINITTMHYFTDDDKRRIKDAAEGHLVDVINDFHPLERKGKDYQGECPVCHGTHKLQVSPAKEIFKCWSCPDVAGVGALSYLYKAEKMDYAAALEYLARKFSVILDEPKPRQQHQPKQQKTMKTGSKEAKGEDLNTYCSKMLAASGLTYEDVTARIYRSDDKAAIFEAKTFRPGTLDERGFVIPGNDVIISYYDLDGLPVTYMRKMPGRGQAIPAEYFRVRWQYPEEHLDKEGKPFKYKSPAGSGTPIYIPERLRAMYRSATPIERLYIQEGEKKAEKACKHGIPSIAVSGIQNLGQRGSLPEDLVKIISTCQVKEVAFVFDSDWNDLSSNIKFNTAVDTRPSCFYAAARNFKEYMRMLKNRGIMVEIFIGHINKNEEGDKGLDDLLADKLAGKEDELAKDFEFACNEKSGKGQYVSMYKITSWNDAKLKSLWNLDNREKFAEQHYDQLKDLPEFILFRNTWRFDENGKMVPALPYEEDEKFWIVTETDTKNGPRKVFEYDYVAAKTFFQNRGIGRYRVMDTKEWTYVHVDPPIVRTIDVEDARDFMFQFAEQHCSRFVNNNLLRGGCQYVGPFQMSRLAFIVPAFIQPSRDEQYFYFKDRCWRVNANEVKEVGYESINHHIWAEQRKNIDVKYLGKPLITFTQTDGRFDYRLSEAGKNCHFLQFLINASNFTWRKKAEEIEEEEGYENIVHLLSKLCAIGYLSMECKDANVTRAVIAMDGKQSEVGDSNGRSGKSLIGELMRQVEDTVYINGKKSDIFNDSFIWNDIDERTKLVFIDDVMQNFNFEFLFPNLTGDWTVNKKGGSRITYPFAKSPKLYIPTNHAIRGSGSSFNDRQWLIAFSDFYNDKHKPMDDFGMLFFSEWDFNQWNLMWNLVANCVQLYLQFGVVQAPGERLEQRKLRQEIGETLISWADEYYSSDEHCKRTARKEVYDAFCMYDPQQRKFISPNSFKKRIKMYCELNGYLFNPHKYDPTSGQPLYFDGDGKPVIDDKSGGVEYFTIGKPQKPEPQEPEQMPLPF